MWINFMCQAARKQPLVRHLGQRMSLSTAAPANTSLAIPELPGKHPLNPSISRIVFVPICAIACALLILWPHSVHSIAMIRVN